MRKQITAVCPDGPCRNANGQLRIEVPLYCDVMRERPLLTSALTCPACTRSTKLNKARKMTSPSQLCTTMLTGWQRMQNACSCRSMPSTSGEEECNQNT